MTAGKSNDLRRISDALPRPAYLVGVAAAQAMPICCRLPYSSGERFLSSFSDALLNDAEAATDRYRYRAFGLDSHFQGGIGNAYTWVGQKGL